MLQKSLSKTKAESAELLKKVAELEARVVRILAMAVSSSNIRNIASFMARKYAHAQYPVHISKARSNPA